MVCIVASIFAVAAVAVSPAATAVATDTPPTRNGMTPGAVAVPAKVTLPAAALDAAASAKGSVHNSVVGSLARKAATSAASCEAVPNSEAATAGEAIHTGIVWPAPIA